MDFHDGIISSFSFDISSESATVKILGYPSANATSRVAYEIGFKRVNYLSLVADVSELSRHEFAGNVTYLRSDDDDGTTKLYMAGGTLLLRAESHSIELLEES